MIVDLDPTVGKSQWDLICAAPVAAFVGADVIEMRPDFIRWHLYTSPRPCIVSERMQAECAERLAFVSKSDCRPVFADQVGITALFTFGIEAVAQQIADLLSRIKQATEPFLGFQFSSGKRGLPADILRFD